MTTRHLRVFETVSVDYKKNLKMAPRGPGGGTGQNNFPNCNTILKFEGLLLKNTKLLLNKGREFALCSFRLKKGLIKVTCNAHVRAIKKRE